MKFLILGQINIFATMNDQKTPLLRYCAAHSTPPDSILRDLERETHLKTLAPQMMSGPLQGQLLRLLSQSQQGKLYLEIGTFTGYAALCIASGIPAGAILHTIEVNQELEYIIRKYIKRANYEDRIQLHIGNAQEIIPMIKGDFDMVFIDAGKQHNALYYDLILDRTNSGGILLIDNVLWGGKVVQAKKDRDTILIDTFNKKVQNDNRVENMLLPIRDGLMVVRKK